MSVLLAAIAVSLKLQPDLITIGVPQRPVLGHFCSFFMQC